ncbi:MAG TPA: chemotaxis protein CheX [Candidatus Aquilonibacter sp.]|nr:chemotaxis protein CheX [Candidatus Aquilonibacter sp.]
MNPILSDRPARVQPDSTWPAIIVQSATEVFQLMLNANIDAAQAPSGERPGQVCAMVGMAGSLTAVFRIRCSKESAHSIATKMLGGQNPGDESAVYDALGEVANMLAGNFKGKISGLSDGCALSVPTVITGENYDVYPHSGGHQIKVYFLYEGKPISITLELSG